MNSIYEALRQPAPPPHIGPKTAICPKCGTDAVIGSETGCPVTSEAFLKAMHTRWFQYTTGPAEYRGQRIAAIAEAKKAGKAYVVIPAQKGTPFESCLLKPESLLCFFCGLGNFNPDDVKKPLLRQLLQVHGQREGSSGLRLHGGAEAGTDRHVRRQSEGRKA